VLAVVSCRTANEPAANDAPKTDTVVSNTPPFKTNGPERYAATRTITIFNPNGSTSTSTTLIARDGPRWREEPQKTEPRVIYLDLPAGRFIVYPDDKVYAASTNEDERANSQSEEPDENSPDRLLHTDPISTTYQALGAERIDERTISKYRIVVNNSFTENVSPSETLMWIDDALKMPIKSETKSADGTRTVMELSSVILEPDKQLFEIPPDYKKVGFSTLQKQLSARRLNP
jgi:outer membrane lipoprotein-sorting protein